MKIRNQTTWVKFKYFGVIFLTGLPVLILIKLHKVDYDFHTLEVTTYELFSIAIVSAIPALQMNKVKYVVSEIHNTNDFIKWLYEYFEKFNGKVIYTTNKIIIFEVEESSRKLFNRREKSYYEVRIQETKATVEGPSYKKPIKIPKNEYANRAS